MSVTIETLIHCDGPCGQVYANGDSRALSAELQRRDAGDEGWIRVVSKDYCPACKSILFPNRKERVRKQSSEAITS